MRVSLVSLLFHGSLYRRWSQNLHSAHCKKCQDNRHKLQQGHQIQDSERKKLFTVRVAKHCSWCSRDATGSPSLERLKSQVREGFGNDLTEVSPTMSKGLDRVTTRSPFRLKLFCVSVIFNGLWNFAWLWNIHTHIHASKLFYPQKVTTCTLNTETVPGLCCQLNYLGKG